MRKLIVGNWKMNGLTKSLGEIDRLADLWMPEEREKADVLICPPATLLAAMADRCKGTGILTGGQDCHQEAGGAYTGEISASMLVDAGATHVILGHSERRLYFGERCDLVRQKAEAAMAAGLIPIICLGETRMERDSGQAVGVVSDFLARSVPLELENYIVSYEPLWAIGTGLVPSPGEIAEIHMAIRQRVGGDVPILYGGSVKPDNAGSILRIANVNGALVGGASLKADDFHGIIKAA